MLPPNNSCNRVKDQECSSPSSSAWVAVEKIPRLGVVLFLLDVLIPKHPSPSKKAAAQITFSRHVSVFMAASTLPVLRHPHSLRPHTLS